MLGLEGKVDSSLTLTLYYHLYACLKPPVSTPAYEIEYYNLVENEEWIVSFV